MAAGSIFQKLVRNQAQPSTTTRLLISHLTATASSRLPIINPPIKSLLLAQSKSQDSNLFNRTHFSNIYPSFSFGYLLNPDSSAGLIVSDDADGIVPKGAEEDSRTIWADSVKKKRKRKMNKHKLKKLRKSLRRKS